MLKFNMRQRIECCLFVSFVFRTFLGKYERVVVGPSFYHTVRKSFNKWKLWEDKREKNRKILTNRGRNKFWIQHPAWEKSTEMQLRHQRQRNTQFFTIFFVVAIVVVPVTVISCASFRISTITKFSLWQSERNTHRENGIIIAVWVHHTWKICQHNLFMCLAWSEANVPNRKLYPQIKGTPTTAKLKANTHTHKHIHTIYMHTHGERRLLLAPAMSLHIQMN